MFIDKRKLDNNLMGISVPCANNSMKRLMSKSKLQTLPIFKPIMIFKVKTRQRIIR